ncbi:hypothetical protein RFI_20715, partial [Reticulomyxa filosa]
MARMGLAVTDTLTLDLVKWTDIEFIKDPCIQVRRTITREDGREEHKTESKALSDGCSIISRDWLEATCPGMSNDVMSMQARVGGAKCEIISLPQRWIRTIIIDDERRKRRNENISEQEIAQVRNLNPKVVITASSHKFEFSKKSEIEVAVKQKATITGLMQIRSLLLMPIFITNDDTGKGHLKNFEDELFKHLDNWLHLLSRVLDNEVDREDAIAFAESRLLKFDMMDFVERAKDTTTPLLQTRDIDPQWLGKLREKQRHNYKDGPCLDYSCRIREYFTFLIICRRHFERKKVYGWAKRALGDCLQKLKFFLPWPSTRMAGAADFSKILKQQEIFLRLYVPLNVTIDCNRDPSQCTGRLEPFMLRCPKCRQKRSNNWIYVGPCGIIRNPCLYPRGYRRFEAIYDKRLDELYPGECLLFSTNESCNEVPVFELSGGDLDGDEFLVVTQKALLPLPNIDTVLPSLDFDSQGEQKLPDYVNDVSLVSFYLQHHTFENTSELAVIIYFHLFIPHTQPKTNQLHDAFCEHFENGVGSNTCIAIAKAHSIAVDFAKQGKSGILPKGIPRRADIEKNNNRVYPHHMGKINDKLMFYSQSIRGRLFDRVLKFLENDPKCKSDTIDNPHWRKYYFIKPLTFYKQLEQKKTPPDLVAQGFEKSDTIFKLFTFLSQSLRINLRQLLLNLYPRGIKISFKEFQIQLHKSFNKKMTANSYSTGNTRRNRERDPVVNVFLIPASKHWKDFLDKIKSQFELPENVEVTLEMETVKDEYAVVDTKQSDMSRIRHKAIFRITELEEMKTSQDDEANNK